MDLECFFVWDLKGLGPPEKQLSRKEEGLQKESHQLEVKSLPEVQDWHRGSAL